MTAASRSSGYLRERSPIARLKARASAARSDFRIGGITRRERLDVSASRARVRAAASDWAFTERFVRRCRARVVDIEVVVRPERPRLAPVRHRGIRIERRRLFERPDRRFVVEAECLRHPLVEQLLCFGVRRPDRMMMLAEGQRGRRGGCGSRCRIGCGRRRFGWLRATRANGRDRRDI